MEDKELLKKLEERSPEFRWQNEVKSAINTIVAILVDKGITTVEEFKKLWGEAREIDRKMQTESLSETEKWFLEIMMGKKSDEDQDKK